MQPTPDTAMILAAGYGLRMRSHCDSLPKPLVPVGGKALIEYPLALLERAGVKRRVVNVHYMGQHIAEYLQQRGGETMFSEERDLLETGGGIVHALPLIQRDLFFVLNSDVLCLDSTPPVLQQMAAQFDVARMDALLLLIPLARATGYEGKGDFCLSPDGVITLRDEHKPLYVYSGIQLLHRRFFDGAPNGAFKLGQLYQRYTKEPAFMGRMCGLVHSGDWLHVGDGHGVAEAEAYLARQTENV